MTRHSDYPICRHTKANGRRCQAPALITSVFCRHHQKVRRTRPATISAGPGLSTQPFHPLQSHESISRTLALILQGIAANRIHPRQAGKMLYACQTAVLNLDQTPITRRT